MRLTKILTLISRIHKYVGVKMVDLESFSGHGPQKSPSSVARIHSQCTSLARTLLTETTRVTERGVPASKSGYKCNHCYDTGYLGSTGYPNIYSVCRVCDIMKNDKYCSG